MTGETRRTSTSAANGAPQRFKRRHPRVPGSMRRLACNRTPTRLISSTCTLCAVGRLATFEGSTATRTERRLSSISLNPIDYKFCRARHEPELCNHVATVVLGAMLVRKPLYVNALRDRVGVSSRQT